MRLNIVLYDTVTEEHFFLQN